MSPKSIDEEWVMAVVGYVESYKERKKLTWNEVEENLHVPSGSIQRCRKTKRMSESLASMIEVNLKDIDYKTKQRITVRNKLKKKEAEFKEIFGDSNDNSIDDNSIES